jgi:hypothetical protein
MDSIPREKSKSSMSTIRPKELAAEIDRLPSVVRAYLRRRFPRELWEVNDPWYLTPRQADIVREHFYNARRNNYAK